MNESKSAKKPARKKGAHYFDDDLLADFCMFFFEICLDQIRFMEGLLRLDQIETRIDWYVETQAKQDKNPLRVETEKLLRAVFIRGTIPRSMAAEIMNMSALIKDGLLQSQSHRTPLTIGLPLGVLPYYFPDLYDPSVISEEYII